MQMFMPVYRYLSIHTYISRGLCLRADTCTYVYTYMTLEIHLLALRAYFRVRAAHDFPTGRMQRLAGPDRYPRLNFPPHPPPPLLSLSEVLLNPEH